MAGNHGNHRSGRKHKPTALHELHGTKPKRPRPHEPRGRLGTPAMPAHIATDPPAAEAWKRHAADLLARGVLTPAYTDLLASLAMTSADIVRTRGLLAKCDYQPVTIESFPDAAGRLRTRLRPNVLRRELERLLRFQAVLLAEWGLGPVSSAKASTITEPEDDEAEAFLRTRPVVVQFPKSWRRKKKTGTED